MSAQGPSVTSKPVKNSIGFFIVHVAFRNLHLRRNAVQLVDVSRRGRGRRILVACTFWLYVCAVLVLWPVLHFGGDRWWPATLLLFGPRWLLAIPIIPLTLFASIFQRKLFWALAVTAGILAFPILGLSLPWGRMFPVSGPRFRVLTYNVADNAVTPDALSELIRHAEPDLVALQECRPKAYADVFRGWHVCDTGDLLIAARFPVGVRQVSSAHVPLHEWPRATLLECVVTFPVGDITVATVHLPSPRYGLLALVDKTTIISPSRRDLLEAETANRNQVSRGVALLVADRHSERILLGDFNMPTDSTLYRRDWLSYTNAFESTGFGFGYTVRASLRSWALGVRIDHVLTGNDWNPVRCWLGPDLGSDHLPVVADLAWQDPDSDRR
jgi:vancomycin resistance protein VanJ